MHLAPKKISLYELLLQPPGIFMVLFFVARHCYYVNGNRTRKKSTAENLVPSQDAEG